MPEPEKMQKRQTAYKLSVKDILDASYVKEEGWQPNFIRVNGVNAARVNVMAAVVAKTDNRNMVIDDGTARIAVKTFEDFINFSTAEVGSIVNCIGKPREFGNERYILPEIVKKITNTHWVELRKKELEMRKTNITMGSAPAGEQAGEERISFEPEEKILSVIRCLDAGDGAEADEIACKSGLQNHEALLYTLLKKGEIFEIKPGKYKVLE